MNRRRRSFGALLVQIALLAGVSALFTPALRCRAATTSPARLARVPAPLQRRTGPPRRPPQEAAPGAIKLTGSERLEWEQSGGSLAQVRSWRYMVVVGVARRPMKDVKCDQGKTAKGPFVCSAPLPPLDQGNHQLRIVAVDERGGHELVSSWSRPVLVFKE